MDHRAEIAEFLASRRARISPQSVGLPVAGRKRRVPGLRREEVAALAGLSCSIRLERRVRRRRACRPSPARCSSTPPQAHLLDLGRAGGRPPRPALAARAAIAPPMQTVLDALVGVPALVRGPTLDLIATNSLARALYSVLFADAGSVPNVARFTFLDPYAHQFFPDWDDVADNLAAHLRAVASPLDPALPQLVGELSTRSDAFRELWARHDVRAHARGVKRFRHPVVGELTLHYDHLQLAAEPALTMITYGAEPGTTSRDNLSLLASWAATAGDAGSDIDQDQLRALAPSPTLTASSKRGQQLDQSGGGGGQRRPVGVMRATSNTGDGSTGRRITGPAPAASDSPRNAQPKPARTSSTAVATSATSTAISRRTPACSKVRSTILSLFLGGHLSDWLGRKRVYVPALLLNAGSALIFVVAPSVPGLFVARIVSGIAIGLATSTATAYLAELHAKRPQGAGRRNARRSSSPPPTSAASPSAR